jgi:hypothetical protein
MCCNNDNWISHADFEAAFQALKMPEGWTNEPEPKKAEIYFSRFRQWREDVYRQHTATLSPSERESLDTGSHPSLSHSRQIEARAYADALVADLRRRGVEFVNEVRIGLYHGDRLILTTMVDAGVDEQVVLSSLPCYYRGFEVRWHRAKKPSEQDAPSNGG